jgi:acetyltransferase-like isoleucine patch superfamily enzyme
MFKRLPRNDELREDILKRFVSSVMTDDERASIYNLPTGCRMREGAKIISPEKFKCGEYVWIGENAILDASGGLEIGNHTSIGLSVFIWSHTSYLANLYMENYHNSYLIERKPTKIGSGCFIGGPSVIYHGCTIGNKVVVLPMSVVTKDIPEYSIVAGSPAKVIKTLTEEEIREEIKRIYIKKESPR